MPLKGIICNVPILKCINATRPMFMPNVSNIPNNMKIVLFSVLPLLMTLSVCFREEETSADNSAPSKNLLNDEH